MKIKQDKTTYYVSPLWLGLAALLLFLGGALGYYYSDQSDNNKRTKARVSASIKTHLAAISSMSANFSDTKAGQMRDHAARIRNAMQTGEDVDRFVASLRPVWSIISRSEEANDEYIRRRYQIARGTVPVSAWPEILGLVGQMATMQSLALTDVDISTVGDNNKREFSRVSFTFTVYIRKPSQDANKHNET